MESIYRSLYGFSCWFPAKVALVKCRDLHWAMMAHRDQRDVSLSSLRMLIVTDGANPCEYMSVRQAEV